MAKKIKIKGIREKQRHLAWLALASGEEKSLGICLESYEMAELIDGKCDSYKQKKLLDHIAHCDLCYREWLQVSSVMAKDNQGRRIVLKKKFYTATGSVFAIAASIMIFWVTPFDPGYRQYLVEPEPQMEKLDLSVRDRLFEDKVNEKKVDSEKPVFRLMTEKKSRIVSKADKVGIIPEKPPVPQTNNVPVPQGSSGYSTEVTRDNSADASVPEVTVRKRKKEQLQATSPAEFESNESVEQFAGFTKKSEEEVDTLQEFKQLAALLCQNEWVNSQKFELIRDRAQVMAGSGSRYSEKQQEQIKKSLELLDLRDQRQIDDTEFCSQLKGTLFSDDNQNNLWSE